MLKTKQQKPKESQRRVLDIDGGLNFRDLGGYQTSNGRVVQWQRLYRSAQLDRLSEQGIEQLAGLGIQTLVDLRFSQESEKYPTIKAAVPEAKIISWHQAQLTQSEKLSTDMQSSWRDSLNSLDPEKVKEAMRLNYPKKLYSHAGIFQSMLEHLVDAKTPLLFHCAAGKDRTGVAAALILSLLGVNNEQIIADYLLTQSELEGRVETWLAGGATDSYQSEESQKEISQYPANVLKPIFSADESYINTLLDYIAENYGDFETYALRVLNFDGTMLTRMRTNLLDG